MQEEIKEMIDKIKKCLIAGYDLDIITQEEMGILWNYITNLQEKYDKALELLVDFNMPCEIDNFNLLDTDYCELNCSVDDEQYKKCWNKFIEWRLQGVDKE